MRILRTFLIATSLIAVPGVIIYLLTSTALSAWVFGMGGGNYGYAQRWNDRLAAFSDPDAAQAAHPEVQFKRFPNGEWVMGVSSDSHASHWGGTVVVKDSTGATHVWFGHVCGPRRLEMSPFQRCNSLKGFYAHDEFRFYDYREITLAPSPVNKP